MAQYGSSQVAFFLIDGYDLIGYASLFNDEIEALTEVTTVLGDAWADYSSVFVSRFAFGQTGFFDDAANASNAALVAAGQGASRVVCYGVEGNTNGKRFEGLQGPVQSKVTRLPAIAGLHKLNTEFKGSGRHDGGHILHAHAVEAGATGNTQATSADFATNSRALAQPIQSVGTGNPATIVTLGNPLGLAVGHVIVANIAGTSTTPSINGVQTLTVTAATADSVTFTVAINVTVGAGVAGTAQPYSTQNGGAAYLQVSALTLGGYTNFAPLVKHSTDNVTFTTLGTFSVVTAAPNAQRLVVAAGTAVNRYLAMSWSYGGAGSGQSVKFFVGFARL